MLYATEDYFVSLDCIGSTSGGGDCTSEKVELTIWGRTWRLDQVTKRTILGELRDRTLRCYAMHALVDVDPNGQLRFANDSVDLFIYYSDTFECHLHNDQWPTLHSP